MKPHAGRLLFLIALLSGCNYPSATASVTSHEVTPGNPSSGLQAWIDRPLEGSRFTLGQEIPIRWHAADSAHVVRVAIRINGETFLLVDDLDTAAKLVSEEVMWTPSTPGEYLIEVIPEGLGGAAGVAAQKRITVLAAGGVVHGAVQADLNQDEDADDPGEGPLAGVTVILVECTEKQSVVTDEEGHFRFESLPLDSDCRMDFTKHDWHTTGTFPAGLDLPIHVYPREEPTAFIVFMSPLATSTPTPTVTLTPTRVRTKTPTRTPLPVVPTKRPTSTSTPGLPPADNDGPPAPAIVGPTGGATLACSASVVLDWKEPYDPSGIANYRVRLQVNPGTGWADVKIWDPVTATQVGANSETTCGGFYRWRIFARDRAGNQGAVSAWAEFSLLLD
jgi:hypothetical protein